MEALGVALDVSHLSDEAFFTALARFRGPVAATHANARAFTPVKGEVQVCMGRALPQSVRVLGRDGDRREPRLGKGLEVDRPQAPTLSPKLGSDANERTSSHPRDS